MSVLIGAVIWPVSIIYMVRRTFNFSGPVLLASGSLSAAFVGFPLMLMDWGVLYPNMLGIALIPAAIVIATQLFNFTQQRVLSTSVSVLLGLIACAGIAIAHPNAIMSYLLILVPLFLVYLVLQWKKAISGEMNRSLAWASTAGVVSVLAVVFVLFVKVRPAEDATWDPTLTQAQAVGEALMNAPMARMGGWFITIMMIVGIVRILSTKSRYVWLVAAWVYMAYFYVAARSLRWEDGRMWTVGVWYSDAYRLGALLPIFGTLFGTVAVAYLVRELAQITTSWSASRLKSSSMRFSTASLALGLIAVVLCTYLGQNSKAMTTYVREVKARYQIDATTRVSVDEMNVLEAIDRYVPPEDTLIVIPETGAGLAYAVADRNVTERHIFYTPTPEVKTIREHLDEAKTNPSVCKAVQDLNAYYYVAFDLGGVFDNPDSPAAQTYRGLSHVYESGVGEEVYRSGGAVLYKITACGEE